MHLQQWLDWILVALNVITYAVGQIIGHRQGGAAAHAAFAKATLPPEQSK